MKQRTLVTFGGLIVLAGLGVWALSARTQLDCSGYVFPASEWRQLRPERPSPVDDGQERRRRELADNLVQCKLLVGATEAEVVRLLGRPDRDETDRKRDHMRTGPTTWGSSDSELLSVTEANLFMEFDRGRVANVQAPEVEPGEGQEGATNGEPVGGGRR